MKELIILSALGVLSLIAGLLRIKRPFMVVVIAGLLLNISVCIMDWNHNENLYNMMTLDNFALAFTILSSSLAILWFNDRRFINGFIHQYGDVVLRY